jgi:hypothetical protein
VSFGVADLVKIPFMSSSPVTNPSAADETLRAQIFQRLHPRVYLERFIAENIRPDGRTFDEWRSVSVNAGTRLVQLFSAYAMMCSLQARYQPPMALLLCVWEIQRLFAVSRQK